MLDICQEMKVLLPILDIISFHHNVRLAAVSLKKDDFDIEEWLSNNLIIHKDVFFEECLRFISEN